MSIEDLPDDVPQGWIASLMERVFEIVDKHYMSVAKENNGVPAAT